MRPHVIIALREARGNRAIPHWQDAIQDRSGTEVPLTPSIGAALARHDLDLMTTREYRPAESGGWTADEVEARLDRVFRLILLRGQSIPRSLLDDLTLLPEVASVRPGRVGSVPLPEIRSAHRRSRYREPQRIIRLGESHRMTQGDNSITIAVLDTGMDLNHPEFAGRIIKPMDFVDIIDGAEEFVGDVACVDALPEDDVGHGTHVAGIAGAAGMEMPVGVAPRCVIMPVRVLAAMEGPDGRVGAGLIDNINAGVKYAVDHGADVINMSLGVERSGGGLPHEDVVRYATAKGVSIVAAAGNDGRENLYYPGALPGVVAVGSCGEGRSVSPFSTYGSHVTLTAPGEEIYSTKPGGYGLATGTSHASPFVAGAIALLQSLARAHGGKFSPRQIRHFLRESGDRVGTAYRDRRAGFGCLNCLDALRLAQIEIA